MFKYDTNVKYNYYFIKNSFRKIFNSALSKTVLICSGHLECDLLSNLRIELLTLILFHLNLNILIYWTYSLHRSYTEGIHEFWASDWAVITIRPDHCVFRRYAFTNILFNSICDPFVPTRNLDQENFWNFPSLLVMISLVSVNFYLIFICMWTAFWGLRSLIKIICRNCIWSRSHCIVRPNAREKNICHSSIQMLCQDKFWYFSKWYSIFAITALVDLFG